jgi:hypothetical protein
MDHQQAAEAAAVFKDSYPLRWAGQRAVASGTELRLAVTDRIVRRALDLSGLDHLVSIYPSVEAAVAATEPAATPPPSDVGDGPAVTPRAALESYRHAAGPCIAEAHRNLTDRIREITLAVPNQDNPRRSP